MNIERTKGTLAKNRKPIAIAAGVALLAMVAIPVITTMSRPERSVGAFCSVYKQEDTRLAKSSGDTYSLHPFTHDSNNPHDFVVALSSLDAVAPNDIEPDVKTLKLLFEKIDKDPSQAFSASMSGLGAESNIADWTTQHCLTPR